MTDLKAVFIGCNKELQISDYNPSLNLIAYGSKNTISIWNPIDKELSSKGILKSLKSHTKHIIAIKWIPETNTLLSTSEDKTIKVWRYDPSTDSFELHQTLLDHHASVTAIAVYNEELFVSGCADGELKVWKLNKETTDYELCESFTIRKGFYQIALALTKIAPYQYALFIGGTNTFLYVYSIVLEDKICINESAMLSGHEDWIRCISIKKEQEGEYLIASGSQDRYIRLWKLRFNEHIDTLDQDKTKLTLLSNKQYRFAIGEGAAENRGALSFDAIIMGHDDWISSLIWHPTEIKLLSASSDTSIMIWEPDMTSGIWVSKVRLGELSIKGASTATGASGGFWSALWIFDKTSKKELILTNGKTGSFRCWSNENFIVEDDPHFVQLPCLTGPSRDVTDLQWSPNGDYLLCTSLDQTTRLFAAYTHNEDGPTKTKSWHEFSRPQIHGYDMICVKPLTSSRFISAGDEKIMRTFDEPKSVSQLLSKFTDAKSNDVLNMPESASLPVLGLSNKAELDNDNNENGQNVENDDENPDNENSKNNITNEILGSLKTPPLEDHLQRHTLWPETEKMYGHGYEVSTLDISPDGKLIASACRSNVSSHAVIRIFRTDTWLQLSQTLAGHELTITRLKWSFDNKYLLAVSRDRAYSLWERKDVVGENYKDDIEFKLVMLKPKAHSRIVWDCCWLPESVGDGMFITCSRDKMLKLWKKNDNEKESEEAVDLLADLKLDKPITALDSYRYSVGGRSIVAVGLETGGVLIYSVDGTTGDFKPVQKINQDFIPSERVNKLAFNVIETNEELLLAIGSADNSVRIISLNISELFQQHLD